MKYKLPRSVISSDVKKILYRAMRQQKLSFLRIKKNNLKEMAELAKTIENEGLPKNLVCKKLPYNLGSGIFLRPDAAPILKGQLIAPYSGEVSIVAQNGSEDGFYAFTPLEDILLKREEQCYFHKNGAYHPRRLYCLKIDGFKEGNFTRFINHSEKPNVVAYIVTIPSNSFGLDPSPIEIVYMAKKKILPGEQLLVSYEDGQKCYWAYTKIKPFPMTPKTFKLETGHEKIFAPFTGNGNSLKRLESGI